MEGGDQLVISRRRTDGWQGEQKGSEGRRNRGRRSTTVAAPSTDRRRSAGQVARQ